MVGKGQPPKDPDDVKKHYSVMLSKREREGIDKAREKTGERIGEFIRTAAIEKADKINKK